MVLSHHLHVNQSKIVKNQKKNLEKIPKIQCIRTDKRIWKKEIFLHCRTWVNYRSHLLRVGNNSEQIIQIRKKDRYTSHLKICQSTAAVVFKHG